ncbi:M4A12 protein, partial [Spizella passerina]|nr:M4A12 protein [Spizella passerina]
MMGFLHIGFGIVLTTLTNVYTSVFVIGEIPFLGGVSVRARGLGRDSHREKNAWGRGSHCVGFILLGAAGDGGTDGVFPILELAGNGISIVLLIFTILEFCIAVATANFWCRATRLNSNEAMLIVPSATRVDLAVPPAELPQPPSYSEVIQGIR